MYPRQNPPDGRCRRTRPITPAARNQALADFQGRGGKGSRSNPGRSSRLEEGEAPKKRHVRWDHKMTAQFAERCNYWKTSRSSPDSWLEKTIGLIEQFGGEVLASGYGNEHMSGRAAYMMRFGVDGETFRIIWPVLPSESGDTLAARSQAATMMRRTWL